MSDRQFITSRVGSRVVQCPIGLLTELQHERQRHHIDIKSRISEVGHNALLAQAERIKDTVYPARDASA